MHNERLANDIEHARRAMILALFIGLVAFILFETLRGAKFWNKVKGEGNLWNFGSSLLYFMAGELALLNAWLITRRDRTSGKAWGWMPWAAAGIAFAYFACDEMLVIHEKLGLRIEESVPIMHRLFAGHVDGLITATYGLGAILFSIGFLRGKLGNAVAGRYFLAGMAMIISAQTLDFLPKDLYIGYLPFRETEELLEVFAGWGFIAAFASSAAFLMTRMLHEEPVEVKRDVAKVA